MFANIKIPFYKYKKIMITTNFSRTVFCIKSHFFPIFFITFLIFGKAKAQQPESFILIKNQTEIAEKLNRVSKNTKYIDSDFKQFKHLDILENDITSKGHFCFKSENNVRWEYFEPYEYLIIMSNNKMWINDGKKTQKYDTKSNKIFKEINDLMIGMLQGDILESNNFTIKFYQNKKLILAELIPRSEDILEFLSKINIFFNKSDYSASKIKMFEHTGDYTLIEFYNKKTNVPVPDFKFIMK